MKEKNLDCKLEHIKEKIYLRFGEIPLNERSINFLQVSNERSEDFSWELDNGNVDSAYKYIKESEFENGVSVFDMQKDGYPKITNIKLYNSLKERLDNYNIYEVTGDVVGLGNDEEPLLRNINILKQSSLTKNELKSYISSLKFEDYESIPSFYKPFHIEKNKIDKEIINKYFEYLKSIDNLNRDVLGISEKDEKFLKNIPIDFWKETAELTCVINKLENIYDLERIAIKILEIRNNNLIEDFLKIKLNLSEKNYIDILKNFKNLNVSQKQFLIKNINELDTFLEKSRVKLLENSLKNEIMTFEKFKESFEKIDKYYKIEHLHYNLKFSEINESLKSTENLSKICKYFKSSDTSSLIEIINHKNANIEILEEILKRKDFDFRNITLKDIPTNLKNEDIYLKFLEKHIINFKYIPKKDITEKIFISAVKKDINIFQKIPKTKRTKEIHNVFWEINIKRSKEQNEKLYRNLLINSRLRKNEIIEMFKNDDIIADYQVNAIFPIKSDGKIVGAYKLDLEKNKKPELLDGSYLEVDDTKSKILSNKVFESIKQEEEEEYKQEECEY